mgnify:CR=1 FL=1
MVRACAFMRAAFSVALMAAALAWPSRAYADPVKGEAMLTQENGYARLLLRFSEEVPTEVSMAGAIMVIRFAKRVDMRYMPDLHFRLDERFDEADRIEQLLHSPEVARDLKKDRSE